MYDEFLITCPLNISTIFICYMAIFIYPVFSQKQETEIMIYSY
jgi:hypothetical protein